MSYNIINFPCILYLERAKEIVESEWKFYHILQGEILKNFKNATEPTEEYITVNVIMQ